MYPNPYLVQALPQLYPQQGGERVPQQDQQMLIDPRAQLMYHNPLAPYNPYMMAQMMQMQNPALFAEGRDQPVEMPKLKDVLENRLKFAVNLTTQNIQNNENPLFILAYGPVRSDKTKFLKEIMDNLEKDGRLTRSYKFVPESHTEETDSNNPNENQFFPAENVKHISELFESIDDFSGGTIIIQDISNLGTKEDIVNFLNAAKKNNVTVIADSLNNKLNGEISEQLVSLVDNSNVVFQFDTPDTLNPETVANSNYVGVPLSLDGEVVDKEGETHYSAMTKYERELIIKKFLALPNHEKLLVRTSGGNNREGDIVNAILLPANKLDIPLNPNPQNVLPLSQANMDKLYKLANTEAPQRMGINSPKVLNWEEIGL